MTAPARIMPDPLATLSQFLRDQPEIVQAVGDRVYSILPKEKEYPLIRVSWIGAQSRYGTLTSTTPWITFSAHIQIDVWAAIHRTASALGDLVLDLIFDNLTGTRNVVNVGLIDAHLDLDDGLTPRMSRFTASVMLTVRRNVPGARYEGKETP